MTDDFDLMIKTEFLSEATELLSKLEVAFLDLEKDSSSAVTINEIFRIAHTIKGCAMQAGFEKLAELAHVTETLLVRIRENVIIPNKDILSVLIKANYRLSDYVAALSDDMSAEIEIRDVVTDIQKHLDSGTEARQPEFTESTRDSIGSLTVQERKLRGYASLVKAMIASGEDDRAKLLDILEDLTPVLETNQ